MFHLRSSRRFKLVLLNALVGATLLGIGFQNCAKVNYNAKFTSSGSQAAGGPGGLSTPLACANSNGAPVAANLSVQGPSELDVLQPGKFSLAGLDQCANIKSFLWTPGDGSPAIPSSNLNHSFSNPGVYRIALALTDASGGVTTIYHHVVVRARCQGAAPNCQLSALHVLLHGPESGRVNQPLKFELTAPADVQLQTADWNFGDSTPLEHALAVQYHTFANAGVYDLLVHVKDVKGAEANLSHRVTILTDATIPNCSIQLAGISSPSMARVNQNVPFSLVMPECLRSQFDSVAWTFGDNGSATGDLDVIHAFQTPKIYTVIVKVWNSKSPNDSVMTFARQILIVDANHPIDIPGCQGQNCSQSNDTCTKEGQTASTVSPPYNIEKSCEQGGIKKLTYTDEIIKKCVRKNDGLFWEEISRTPALQSEGACMNKACRLPAEAQNQTTAGDPKIREIEGIKYLLDGQSLAFYSSMLPKKACSEVRQVLTCMNGNLGNSEVYKYLKCTDGCAAENLASGESSAPYHLPNYSETVACKNGGSQTNSYYDEAVKRCENGAVTVVKTNTHILATEGQCKNQKCVLNGVTYQPGQEVTFYSTSSPAGLCSDVSQKRICNGDTGLFNGSSSYSLLTCVDGCPGFGANGTIKDNVVSGTLNSERVCPLYVCVFFDIYERLVTQKCESGRVVSSNERKGRLLTPGVCPVYTWTPTDRWTTCTADCGGLQTRIYACKDSSSGQIVDSSRCAGQEMVAETRVCDGDPNYVRIDKDTRTEEANSCHACPANQIGIVLREREVTIEKTFKCIDHKIKLASQREIPGPWKEERYCRPFNKWRCSQDSLNNSMAEGRYKWMVKCRNENKAIDEFLTKFATVKFSGVDTHGNQLTSTGLTSQGRHLYATFFDGKTDKPWIAPTSSSASCKNIPIKAYVAGVCISSCVTPEESILADLKMNGEGKPMSMIEALMNNAKGVKVIKGKGLTTSMPVDQWVTEMVDSDHRILLIKTRSGSSIRVTLNHPLLDGKGKMREASDLRVGDSLVRAGSLEQDPIVSIQEFVHRGKVYNLFMKDDSPENNLVSIQGFVSGTAYFQNEGHEYIDREVLRRRLIQPAKLPKVK